MSKRRIVLSIITGLAVSTTAVALTLPNGEEVEELTGNARWGCEVLLCLSNPNGPRAVAECRPPIDKLFKCLSKRHPCKFPKCPQAGAGNEAKQLSDHYDPCFYTVKATKKLRKAISEKPMFRPKPQMPIYPSTPKEEPREEVIPTFNTTITGLTNTIPKTTAGKQQVQRRV